MSDGLIRCYQKSPEVIAVQILATYASKNTLRNYFPFYIDESKHQLSGSEQWTNAIPYEFGNFVVWDGSNTWFRVVTAEDFKNQYVTLIDLTPPSIPNPINEILR